MAPRPGNAGGDPWDQPVTPQPAARGFSARRHGVGFWSIGLAFLTAMAFSTVPTPLYPLYQARDGFSTFTITVIFAAYAVGAAVSLLMAGHVSDWVGRKKILILALGIEVVAAALFVVTPSLPGLLAARLLTGLGVGMITATATAHLQELHAAHRPGASQQRFEVVSTAANIGGLGLGPLVAGLLAQHVRAPLYVPYLIFVILLLVSIAAVALTPETVRQQLVRPTYRPQRISAGHGDPRRFVAAAVAGLASFAVFSLFTSLAPAFVSGTLHHSSRALAGFTVFVVFASAAVAQTLTSRLAARAQQVIGRLAQGAGLILLLVGMHAASLPAFLVGGIVAGAGAGALFKASIGTVAAMAAADKRGEALAGLFLICYLGLIVPAVGMGVATHYVAATTAMSWLTGVLLVVLATVGVLAQRPHDRSR